MASEAIEGQVAKILSDRELVINRGSEHGVSEDNYFIVLGPPVDDITDPETQESLSGLRHVKAVVVATEVARRITLAKTFLTESVNVGGYFNINTGKAFTPAKYIERVELLHADDSELPVVDKEALRVAVGDTVQAVPAQFAKDGPKVTIYEKD